MAPRGKAWPVLLALACLLVAQAHAWTDIDLCMRTTQVSHRSTGHGPNGHGCQNFLAASCVLLAAPPALAFTLSLAQAAPGHPAAVLPHHFSEVRSPRAPPALAA